MRTHFMARFRPADDTAWADPDTDPRLHFRLVTDLRGVRGYDSSAGQRLSRELEVRFSPDPGDGPDPDPECTDLVDRVQWGIAPTIFPHFDFPASALRVFGGAGGVLVAGYTPPAYPDPATLDANGEQLEVQFPAGNLSAWLAPAWGVYAIATRYDPPLGAGERALVCRPIGPGLSMEVPARLVILVDGNAEVVAEAVGDGKTAAFPLNGSVPDPEPTHSGLTWFGALVYDGSSIELDFFGTIDEQWTLTVANNAAIGRVVRVRGGRVGAVGDYPLGATISPMNTEATAPYFTMPAEGWLEGGDPPQLSDVLIFTTSAAAIVPPDLTCDASLVLDQAALDRWMAKRGDPPLLAGQDYPVYLETAQPWGELTWRGVHNCPLAASEWLSGQARFARDRPSDGAVWVSDRRRAQVGVLRLSPRWVVTLLLLWGSPSRRDFVHELYLNGHYLGNLNLSDGAPGVHFVPAGYPLDGYISFDRRLSAFVGPVVYYDPGLLVDGLNTVSWSFAGHRYPHPDCLGYVNALETSVFRNGYEVDNRVGAIFLVMGNCNYDDCAIMLHLLDAEPFVNLGSPVCQ